MDLSRKSQTSTNTSEFDSRSIQGRESLIFQTYVTFSIDFRNTYNDYLPANVIDSFLLLFWQTKAISPALPLRVSHPLCSCSFGFCDEIMDELSSLKNRFSVKDRGSNETLGKIEADF